MILFDKSGYAFKNSQLLEQALTHKSHHNEHAGKSLGHNEKLEFLGDAVLELALTDYLLKALPDLSEGELSKVRASLVNETVLADLAKEFGVAEHIRLGKGERVTGGDEKPRLLSSTLEAIVGAIFLDSGFQPAQNVVVTIFKERVAALDLTHHFQADYKTRLQEEMQKKMKTMPVYEMDGEEGPDHEKIFFVRLLIQGQVKARGRGRSKKQAEQDAARIFLETNATQDRGEK